MSATHASPSKEIVVVGAGPGGVASAILLASAGARLLLEDLGLPATALGPGLTSAATTTRVPSRA